MQTLFEIKWKQISNFIYITNTIIIIIIIIIITCDCL
jgi:hypothetical protein